VSYNPYDLPIAIDNVKSAISHIDNCDDWDSLEICNEQLKFILKKLEKLQLIDEGKA